MVSKAIARFARISPRKARVVVNLVRGRHAGEALQLLEFTKKSGAPVLRKIIESAVANARTQSPGVDLDTLFVETAFVDKAPNKFMRRWRPRAMGRATRVNKGVSHIAITLTDTAPKKPAPRTRKPADGGDTNQTAAAPEAATQG